MSDATSRPQVSRREMLGTVGRAAAGAVLLRRDVPVVSR